MTWQRLFSSSIPDSGGLPRLPRGLKTLIRRPNKVFDMSVFYFTVRTRKELSSWGAEDDQMASNDLIWPQMTSGVLKSYENCLNLGSFSFELIQKWIKRLRPYQVNGDFFKSWLIHDFHEFTHSRRQVLGAYIGRDC